MYIHMYIAQSARCLRHLPTYSRYSTVGRKAYAKTPQGKKFCRDFICRCILSARDVGTRYLPTYYKYVLVLYLL